MLWILHQKEDKIGIELVRQLIFEHLAESGLGRQNNLYEKFIGNIFRERATNEVAIISFNFDVLLHEDFIRGIYFDYLVNFDWIDPSRAEIYAHTNPIKLIKLNGSLDWAICPSCKKTALYFFPTFRHFFNDKKCRKCNEPLQPFIIIPHEKYEDIFETIWSSAEEELREADKVTVIGYSFPDYDKKVIGLFTNTLASDVILEVVTHCERQEYERRTREATIEKYERLFPKLKKKINTYLTGFEGYLNVVS